MGEIDSYDQDPSDGADDDWDEDFVDGGDLDDLEDFDPVIDVYDEQKYERAWAQAPFAARFAIFAATCRASNKEDFPHIRVDLLGSVSRTAIHYALGGSLEQLTMHTIGLRSGLQLVHQGIQIGSLKAGDVINAPSKKAPAEVARAD